jgi:enterochelin esterase-like enzyme
VLSGCRFQPDFHFQWIAKNMKRLWFILVLGWWMMPVHSSQLTCDETEGRVERTGYRSQAVQTNMVYSIYLPPCYDATDAIYPVLYLMHGSNDDDNHWLRLGLKEYLDQRITNGEIPPLIVVLPFGNWVANENQFGVDSWQNVFLSELMPLVESSYRIDARREARGIGGISRGGFWAFNIAFRHPDLFSTVGGHSGFFAERQGPPEHTPLNLATDEAENIQSLRIWLDRGADDYAAPGLELMHERLDSAGVMHTYTVYPEGQHTNPYWRGHLPEYVDFYVAEWGEATNPTATPGLFITNTPQVSNPVVTPTATPHDSSSTGIYVFLRRCSEAAD